MAVVDDSGEVSPQVEFKLWLAARPICPIGSKKQVRRIFTGRQAQVELLAYLTANAARRIRTCNQGIQAPSRFHEAWTISSSSTMRPPSGPPVCPETVASRKEAGRCRRGLLLGLTPLVSEPSWPPMPGQAWLRIAVLRPRRTFSRPVPNLSAEPVGSSDRGPVEFRFPAIHPVRNRRLPSAATFF